jgi:hypothetical protein
MPFLRQLFRCGFCFKKSTNLFKLTDQKSKWLSLPVSKWRLIKISIREQLIVIGAKKVNQCWSLARSGSHLLESEKE